MVSAPSVGPAGYAGAGCLLWHVGDEIWIKMHSYRHLIFHWYVSIFVAGKRASAFICLLLISSFSNKRLMYIRLASRSAIVKSLTNFFKLLKLFKKKSFVFNVAFEIYISSTICIFILKNSNSNDFTKAKKHIYKAADSLVMAKAMKCTQRLVASQWRKNKCSQSMTIITGEISITKKWRTWYFYTFLLARNFSYLSVLVHNIFSDVTNIFL